MNKYKNKKIIVDDYVFDSIQESKNDFPYLEIMSLIITGLGVGFLVYAKRKKK